MTTTNTRSAPTIEYQGELLGNGISQNENGVYTTTRRFILIADKADPIQVISHPKIPRINSSYPRPGSFNHCTGNYINSGGGGSVGQTMSFDAMYDGFKCTNREASSEKDEKGEKWLVTCTYTRGGGGNMANSGYTYPWKMPPYNIRYYSTAVQEVMDRTYRYSLGSTTVRDYHKLEPSTVVTIDASSTRDDPEVVPTDTAGNKLLDLPTVDKAALVFEFSYNLKWSTVNPLAVDNYVNTINDSSITILGHKYPPGYLRITALSATFVPVYNHSGSINRSRSYYQLDIQFTGVEPGKRVHCVVLSSFGFKAKDWTGTDTDPTMKKVSQPIYIGMKAGSDYAYGFYNDFKAAGYKDEEIEKVSDPVPLDGYGRISGVRDTDKLYKEIRAPASAFYYPYWARDWDTLQLPSKKIGDY